MCIVSNSVLSKPAFAPKSPIPISNSRDAIRTRAPPRAKRQIYSYFIVSGAINNYRASWRTRSSAFFPTSRRLPRRETHLLARSRIKSGMGGKKKKRT